MKMLRFVGISAVLHLLVLFLLMLRFQAGFIMTNDTYVQLNDEKHSIDMKTPKPFVMGEAANKKMKPVINTNFQELQKEDNEDAGGGSPLDLSGYVPSYQVEELPIPLSPISPKYPEEARRTGIEGKVLVMLYIDELGNVKKVEIQKSPSDLLSKSALEAVSSTRFRPAKIGGAARAVCMLLTLKFHLE